MIHRSIQAELSESAAEYPAVTILGPRQSGKTTLARMCFPRHAYLSLEDPDVRKQASEDPRGLLALSDRGMILDEIQRVPQMLSYLQGMIDENRSPGRFILTGSHQPQVHEAVAQSLAGRTAVLELLPFTIPEARHYENAPRSPFEWVHRGFYPGVYENDLDPPRFFRSYTSTYIERDLRSLVNLKDLAPFETFLRLIAGRVGQLVNFTALGNDVGVSGTTIRNWISLLKASYILFELPPWHANVRKRLVKSPKLYFVDVGLAAWLLGLELPEQIERDPLRGALYENLLVLEVVKTLLNQGRRPLLHFFRDSNGKEVDLIVPSGPRSFTAIEIKSAATFTSSFVKGIEIFRKLLPTEQSVEGRVWYNGSRETSYGGVTVSNPLRHGFVF